MVDQEDPWRRRGRERAERSWIRPPALAWSDDLPGDVVDPRDDPGGLRLCLAPLADGQRCDRLAGSTTSHFGVGRCRRCGGNTREGRAEAAWMVARSIAAELDVTPWDALLTVVRRSAAVQEYWYDQLTTQLYDPSEFEDPGSQPSGWLRNYLQALRETARFSKMAVDAGVAERMAAVQEVQAAVVVRVLNEALSQANLPPEVESRMRTALAGSLRALETGVA